MIPEIRLDMPARIDSVLPDLHYLSSGSGDIAQLNYFAEFFDAWLDRLYTETTKPGEVAERMAEPRLREFYAYAEKQLTNMNWTPFVGPRGVGFKV